MSRHLLDGLDADLRSWCAAAAVPAFRVGQIRNWIFAGRAADFSAMSNLPLSLRETLAGEFHLWSTKVARHEKTDDGTEKLLLELHDGHRVECVLLREEGRRSICISTQVGCAMGCVFCASGLDGVVRNLTRGEILEQILRLDRLLPKEERLSHVVVMGMGEPLANLDRLLPALAEAASQQGLGISARRITISTVGLPAAMAKLAEKDVPYHLAVSLHAPNDELRNKLVPVSRKIGIEAVLEGADRFFDVTGRRVTYEYVMLAGLNDQIEHARQLARLLGNRTALVNLIPFNPVKGLPYRTPHPNDVQKFVDVLRKNNVEVHIRKRKGDRINAACGQLRRSFPGAASVVQLSPAAANAAVEAKTEAGEWRDAADPALVAKTPST